MTCNKRKWVHLIIGNKTVNLLENDRFEFLGVDKHEVNGITELSERKGMDGGIPTKSTFGPFELKLHFRYNGIDSIDLDLFCFELEQKIQRRDPYYVRHSKMPGLKYAVLGTPKVSPSNFAIRYSDIEIAFTVYKGYCESYLSTDEMSLSNQTDWQFGNNMIAFNESDNYHHRTKKFRIYNGSIDTIDPTLDHTLNITIHTNAPNGFKLRNRKTGDVFEYYGALLYTDTFMLKGVYPVVNGKRVGADTNNSWITLDEGFNDFIVTGEGITDFDITFSFSFIYR